MELTVTALPNETPGQHMTRLGQMSKKVMAGRINAMQGGLNVIHLKLAELSSLIDEEQARLLAVHPELIMMVFEGVK